MNSLHGQVYQEIHKQKKLFPLHFPLLTGKFLKENQETEVETNNWKFKLGIILMP